MDIQVNGTRIRVGAKDEPAAPPPPPTERELLANARTGRYRQIQRLAARLGTLQRLRVPTPAHSKELRALQFELAESQQDLKDLDDGERDHQRRMRSLRNDIRDIIPAVPVLGPGGVRRLSRDEIPEE